MQKHKQALNFWSNFSLVLFGKRREIHRTTLTNLCINWDNITKSICQFWQDHNNNFDKSNNWNKNKQEHGMTEWQGKVMIWLGSDKNILSLFFCSTAGWPIWLFRQWDSEGNLKVWWTPATDEKCVWLFFRKVNFIQNNKKVFEQGQMHHRPIQQLHSDGTG